MEGEPPTWNTSISISLERGDGGGTADMEHFDFNFHLRYQRYRRLPTGGREEAVRKQMNKHTDTPNKHTKRQHEALRFQFPSTVKVVIFRTILVLCEQILGINFAASAVF